MRLLANMFFRTGSGAPPPSKIVLCLKSVKVQPHVEMSSTMKDCATCNIYVFILNNHETSTAKTIHTIYSIYNIHITYITKFSDV